MISRYGRLVAIDARRFYAQRAARILPLLLTLLFVLSLLHLAGVPGFVIDKPSQSLGGALFSALGLHLNWYEGRTGWLPGNWDVLWSLSIEEVFYLAFPLACLWLPRPLQRLALAALVVSLPWTRAALDGMDIWQEKAYLPAFSAIALGVLAAELRQQARPSRAFARCLLALGAATLAAAMLCTQELWRATGHASLLVIAAANATILLGCAWSEAGAPPKLRWLARMGRLSYELYLTHMFVDLGTVALWRAWLGPGHALNPWAYTLAIIGCVLLAMAIERHFSSPMDRWLRARLSA